MKRNIAEPSGLSQSPAKSQKRPVRRRPTAVSKDPSREMQKPNPYPPPQEVEPNAGDLSGSSVPEDLLHEWDSAWEIDSWWLGVVDEDKLLGWFPFVDEDFHCFCSENRGGTFSAFFWEDYHDIWHLKHIHEIPSCAKR